MITGRIKQIETMGLVDGPGIRVVVFMQGCSLRCLFCHNPEMWNMEGGEVYTPDQLVALILKYKNYFGEKGGVTFSGGEPLMQPLFLLECLKLCKQNNIHTCIDTAGVGNGEYDEDILKYTDLVLYDIKALDNTKYKHMTGSPISITQSFLLLCEKLNKKLWIRSVMVPGINDTDEYIGELARYIKHIKNIEKIELLPYHTMGKNKYSNLNIKYPLEDTLPMDAKRCKEMEEKLLKMLK